ncbi:MAG: sphingomyelin phosphodiesterase [Bacteroidetes bacterium]|nr:sphingomyelin phosphodiesterase [Bacteroidota bacterium]
MRLTIAGLLFFLSISFCQAQDSLKILSWNIQMLPRGVKGNGKAKRARIIAEELKQRDYDVVVFQELFYHRSRTILLEQLKEKYPHQTQVLNKKLVSFKTNGGVLILSKHPIIDTREITYRQKSGPDRLSRKGALLATLNVNGKKLQVVGTHLQAFGKKEIMYSQYQQLHDELLKPTLLANVPQIVCGDFNTLKEVPAQIPASLPANFEERIARYPVMLRVLQAEDGNLKGVQQYSMDRPNNDLCKKRKEFRLLLDYFLIRSNQSAAQISHRQITIIKKKWHKNHSDLSDHYGLEAVVKGF